MGQVAPEKGHQKDRYTHVAEQPAGHKVEFLMIEGAEQTGNQPLGDRKTSHNFHG